MELGNPARMLADQTLCAANDASNLAAQGCSIASLLLTVAIETDAIANPNPSVVVVIVGSVERPHDPRSRGPTVGRSRLEPSSMGLTPALTRARPSSPCPGGRRPVRATPSPSVRVGLAISTSSSARHTTWVDLTRDADAERSRADSQRSTHAHGATRQADHATARRRRASSFADGAREPERTDRAGPGQAVLVPHGPSIWPDVSQRARRRAAILG